MLLEARRLYPSLRVVSARAESLPFREARFHLAFSVDVIHHVADRAKAFVELTRVLDDDGAVCTVTETPEMIRTRSVLSVFFPETVGADLARYPTSEALRAEMSDAGLEIYRTANVEQPYTISNIRPFEARVFSCLRVIPDAAVKRGLAALRDAVAHGPVTGVSRYVAIWARHRHARNSFVEITAG
jgi:SAM-dependent methyltransferase